jgi:hypothetical protein
MNRMKDLAAPLASGHSGVIAVVVERFDLVN